MDKAICSSNLFWHNLYRGQYDLWVDEAYQHPAKMSPALAFRIIGHLEGLGLLKEGDTILDFMAGIGTTGLVAMAKGYWSIMVELEPKFIDLMGQNRAKVERQLSLEGDWMQIIQGDARQLSQLLQERGLVGVTSPPYEQNPTDLHTGKAGPIGKDSRAKEHRRGDVDIPTGKDYGQMEGQIGNLPDKRGLCGITSPPYSETDTRRNRKHQSGRIAINLSDGPQGHSYGAEHLGTTPGQIGRLRDSPLKGIVSPPYSEKTVGGKFAEDASVNPAKLAWRLTRVTGKRNYERRIAEGYTDNPNNIGNLPDRPLKAITSPPYEDSDNRGHTDNVTEGITADGRRRGGVIVRDNYGGSNGQIGQERGETYLSAMAQVYAEAAKVCDVLVVVVKDPTREGKIRELGKDTWTLLEHTGWTVVDYHKAILFEEQEQGELWVDGRAVYGFEIICRDGESKTKKRVSELPDDIEDWPDLISVSVITSKGKERIARGRLSFFKRDYWKKEKGPVSNFEHVLIAQRISGESY